MGELRLTCGCGGEDSIHALGTGGCFREVVPENEEPMLMWGEADDFDARWRMPGGYEITGFTLLEQRMYAYHSAAKRWSRPKDHESVNSLDWND